MACTRRDAYFSTILEDSTEEIRTYTTSDRACPPSSSSHNILLKMSKHPEILWAQRSSETEEKKVKTATHFVEIDIRLLWDGRVLINEITEHTLCDSQLA